VLRHLAASIQWRRLSLYAFLGLVTAATAFLAQAGLDLVNWSMPLPYHWSDVGQFHFLVMWAEVTYLYLVLATAVNNWSALRREAGAWSTFWLGLLGLALFAWTLAADYIR
jgi:hypothetical protein